MQYGSRSLCGLFCALVLAYAGVVSAQGINVSVDAGAQGVGGSAVAADNDPAHVFICGGGTNAKRIDKTLLGLGAGDNIDALAFPQTTLTVEPTAPWMAVWHFSVDPAAAGAGGTAVNTQQGASPPEAAGDVFHTGMGGVAPNTNFLAVDESVLGLAAATAPEDDQDALDLDAPFLPRPLPRGSLFFSLAAGSPSLTPAGRTPGDILMPDGNGGFELAVTPFLWCNGDEATLGIVGQDLDALFTDSVNFPYFSIAAPFLGVSTLAPGDILCPDGQSTWPPSPLDGQADIVVTAPQIGLLPYVSAGSPGDNLNALDAFATVATEPGPPEFWYLPFTGRFLVPVPDNNQPPGNGQPNYCTPASALNVLEYWQVNQAHPNAQGLLDPADLVPGPGVRPLSTTNNHIGWFMDTNNLGSPARVNPGFAGTCDIDILPGLIDFMLWDAANLMGYVAPPYAKVTRPFWMVSYTNRFFANEALGWSELMQEIDSARPLVMNWAHWSLGASHTAWMLMPGGGIEPVTFYLWGAPASTGDPTGDGSLLETWSFQLNEEIVGHSVTAVGYFLGLDPDGPGAFPPMDWVVVHDNWSSTPRNVAVMWADVVNAAPNNPATWWTDPTAVSWWVSNVPADPDLDSDSDGMPDWWEDENGLDPGAPDEGDDPDGDGLDNGGEYGEGTDPQDDDSDDDGMLDGWEVDNGFDPNDPSDASGDPDGDGLTNAEEHDLGTNPNSDDTDADSLPDGWEAQFGLDPLDDGSTDPDQGADGDPDGDQQSNLTEYLNGTNPLNPEGLPATGPMLAALLAAALAAVAVRPLTRRGRMRG